MIFRRKDRERGNPTDLLQRLRSLHDLLDPTTEDTGEDGQVEHHERGRGLTLDVDSRERQVPSPETPETFDDDVPLLMDVVTPEELASTPAAAPSSTNVRLRPLTSDAEVVRALASLERAVSRHLGHALDAAQNQAVRSDIRRSLTRMLAELEAQWRQRTENNGR
jgi:hypothetical protein